MLYHAIIYPLILHVVQFQSVIVYIACVLYHFVVLLSVAMNGGDDYSVVMEGGRPWGFSLQGGLEFRAPLRVGKVSVWGGWRVEWVWEGEWMGGGVGGRGGGGGGEEGGEGGEGGGEWSVCGWLFVVWEVCSAD